MASAEIDELVAELPARSELDGFWDRMDARLADGGAGVGQPMASARSRSATSWRAMSMIMSSWPPT